MPWWNNHPWRMIQTNMREIDYQDIDAQKFVDDLLSFHATVLLINAGGISASYDTQLPFQHRNPYLQDSRILPEIVGLCHQRGIRVLARADFSKIPLDIFEKHPDWAYRTRDGQPMVYNGYVQTCITGEYQQKYSLEILSEIFSTIPFDGLYCNMGGFQTKDYSHKEYGICHCKSCRDAFKRYAGADLPAGTDMRDLVYVKYLAFKRDTVAEHRHKIAELLTTFGRDLCFDGLDYVRLEAASELNNVPIDWKYHASSNCRGIRTAGRNSIICSNTSVDFLGFALRHVSVSPSLQRMRLWQSLVNFGVLDYYLMGRIDNHLDRSACESVRGVFRFHEEHQQVFEGLRPVAEVLLRRTDRWIISEEEKGWIGFLTEHHILFAEVLPQDFLSLDLHEFKVVVLPDCKWIPQEEAEKIDHYVAGGGKVVSSGETAFYDDQSGLCRIPGIRSLGIRELGEIHNSLVSSMLFIPPKDKASLLHSFKDIDVIPIGSRYVDMSLIRGTRTLLKLIPPHPYGPPECCYFTEVTDKPGIIMHEYEEGLSFVLPWFPGTFYYHTGQESIGSLFTDILVQGCGVHPVSDSLTPMVELSAANSPGGSLVMQFVNNSGSFGLDFVPPLPVFGCACSMSFPEAPSRVASIRGETVDFSWDGGRLSFVLERLDEYDAVIIT